MHVVSIKTHKITVEDNTLITLLDQYVPALDDGSVLCITSKIVAICEGRVVKAEAVDKQQLIEQEAEYFLPPSSNKYNVTLTVKNNLLIASAGLDESNGNGYYVLWPRDSQRTANEVRAYLCQRFGLQRVGVLITDSKTTPLRWGVIGVSVAHSGFQAVNNLIGTPDIFGRELHMTRVDVADALAASAVLVMGEGREQTPLAVISDVPFVNFQDRDPTADELERLRIDMADDLYGPLLTSVKWEKGGKD
jgi:putative folate metabolism gamma-glutamate ligase